MSHTTVANRSRRRFMQSTAAVGSAMLMPPPARAESTSLEAYTSASSIPVGGTLQIHARDPQAADGVLVDYPLTIVRMGAPDTVMLATTIALGFQPVPADAYATGCRWAPSWRIAVPNTWPSGLYWASIGDGANACNVPFVVRPAGATAGVKVLVLVPTSTVHAYNPWGGKSLYDYNSSGGVRAPKVSYDRPFSEPYNSSFDGWQASFIRWVAKNRIAADYCTTLDLHAEPGLLDPYRLFVTSGHDEYWSLEMRQHLDAFVAKGGNAAIFGGNTCWWQARFEDSSAGANRTLVCYKSAADDPIADRSRATLNWRDVTPPNPENGTTGLSYIKGAGWTVPQRPDTPFVAQRPEHWVFAGTGLAQSAPFGGAYVGYETDAADAVTGADGRLYPTGLDGTPPTLRILAQADATGWDQAAQALDYPGALSGYAAMAVFSRGGAAGTVFNAGVTDWAYGLNAELAGQAPTPLSRITLNVFNKLSARWSETADVRQFHGSTAGRADNCYYTIGTQGPAGMAHDGLAFRALAGSTSGAIPIYRYRSRNTAQGGARWRFATHKLLDLLGLVWILEPTPAFYAYASYRDGTVPVYEFFAIDPLLQFSYRYGTAQQAPAGWFYGGVRFYAPAA